MILQVSFHKYICLIQCPQRPRYDLSYVHSLSDEYPSINPTILLPSLFPSLFFTSLTPSLSVECSDTTNPFRNGSVRSRVFILTTLSNSFCFGSPLRFLLPNTNDPVFNSLRRRAASRPSGPSYS